MTFGHRRPNRREAPAHGIEVRHPSCRELGVERFRRLGLARALMGEREQADHRAAGMALVATGEQCLEAEVVGAARNSWSR